MLNRAVFAEFFRKAPEFCGLQANERAYIANRATNQAVAKPPNNYRNINHKWLQNQSFSRSNNASLRSIP